MTHDQEGTGRLRQVGTPREIYESPADPWVAGVVGQVNLLRATLDGAALRLGPRALRLSPDALTVSGLEAEVLERRSRSARKMGQMAHVHRGERTGILDA